MTKLARTLIALGSLACVLACLVLLPKLVEAAPYPPAYDKTKVTHVEHTALRIETHPGYCVRGDFTTVIDAGYYLSGEPDAQTGWPFDGPDAAIWQTGGDAAVWIPPDASAMGPRPRPKRGLNYQCTCRDNPTCWKQGTTPLTCAYTAYWPADMPTAPFAFSVEPDGGEPTVWGVSTSGTSKCECCPVFPSIMSGN